MTTAATASRRISKGISSAEARASSRSAGSRGRTVSGGPEGDMLMEGMPAMLGGAFGRGGRVAQVAEPGGLEFVDERIGELVVDRGGDRLDGAVVAAPPPA